MLSHNYKRHKGALALDSKDSTLNDDSKRSYDIQRCVCPRIKGSYYLRLGFSSKGLCKNVSMCRVVKLCLMDTPKSSHSDFAPSSKELIQILCIEHLVPFPQHTF